MGMARDSLQWYGTLYGCIVSAVTLKAVVGGPKSVPPIAAAPIVMGGFMLTNMYDVAYGNKMVRVRKEAENIIEHERHLFVPPQQAPFHSQYPEPELLLKGDVQAVSSIWPSFLPMHRYGA